MAKVRFPTGIEREIPDEALMTERGVEWADRDGKHIIPWTAILEFTGPTPDVRIPSTADEMVEALRQ
jgi:hypothetical protein